MELILQVGVGRLTEQHKDTLVRQLAALLNVLDSDIRVQKIQAHSDLRYEPRSPAWWCSAPLSFCVCAYTCTPFVFFFFFSSKGSSKGMI